jgi:hypothetical protein
LACPEKIASLGGNAAKDFDNGKNELDHEHNGILRFWNPRMLKPGAQECK